MDASKRRALEESGWLIGEAEDFLGLTPGERKMVELRLQVSRAVAARRRMKKLSQAKVAELMGTSQPRYNRIESGAQGVSLDLMFRALLAMGGSLSDLTSPARAQSKVRRVARKVVPGVSQSNVPTLGKLDDPGHTVKRTTVRNPRASKRTAKKTPRGVPEE